jgi:hypothetical protein
MATTKIWPVRGWLGQVVDYAMNPDKTGNPEHLPGSGKPGIDALWDVMAYATRPLATEQKYYVTGVNCVPEIARQQMTLTKNRYGKEGGIVAFHAYQSFAPGEVTPQQAHSIGVELVRRLWGSRFEVVVATHLDKEHIHCHFVLNSVSFCDGKRYNDCKATYREFREMSDRICREHGLSVIINPSHAHTPRSIYMAEKEGKPTLYNIIRADVDEAISHSVVPKQVYAALRQMGYEVHLNAKYIAVRLPGRERFTRLKTLGENYSEEAIQRRVMRNPLSVQYTRPLSEPQTRTSAYRHRGNMQAIKKITGLQALYLHYCYRMGILPKNAQKKSVHPLLKADLLKMDAIRAETILLCKNRISTSAELAAFKAWRTTELMQLESERSKLNNRLRRASSPDEITNIKEQRTAITKNITGLRKDLKLVSGIENRNGTISEKLHIIADDHRQEITRQEQKLAAKKRNYYR